MDQTRDEKQSPSRLIRFRIAVRSTVRVSSLLLTIGSAYFLSRGNLTLSPSAIANLASTGWGYNTSLLQAFCSQWADTWVGVVLLLAGLILQMSDLLFFRLRWADFDINKKGAIVAFIVSLAVFIIMIHVSNHMAAAQLSHVQAILPKAQQ